MTLDHHTDSIQIVLEVVTDQRRRTVLNHLRTTDDDVVHLDELVNRLPHTETPAKTSPQPPSHRQGPSAHDQLRLELHHAHLPKLDDVGIVEYDPRSETVRYHPTPRLEKLLAFIETELE
ncbi:hypothetical protein [Saliphagus sp. LR7]|uniref:DUF7344 domain-containing protein n=1 Tax=Saliphagus sp. LR7 TaxID=2282654 RepID=UPI000DF764DA|nr:hypothetical protein [Saliphagus sp. LR7]